MSPGFFTIEQWTRPAPKAEPQWVAVEHLNADHTLSDAIRRVERMGKPGFFRVQQVQRIIWAENVDGALKLRKWHAARPEELARAGEAFERDGGHWPVEKERAERAQMRVIHARHPLARVAKNGRTPLKLIRTKDMSASS